MSRLLDLLAGMSGTVLDFAGTTAPNGWLLCYGQSVLRVDYPNLFAAIGTTYGSVDGTHFTLPDCRGRVHAGKDDMGGAAASRLTSAGSGVAGAMLGGSGGAETHTLTTGEMPAHSHAVTDPGHTHNAGGSWLNVTAGGNVNAGTGIVGFTTIVIDSHATGVSIQNNGGGTAHPIAQPTLVLNKIIKT